MTDQEIQTWKDRIDKMSHREMASLYRFSPSGHPCFDLWLPLNDYFMERFNTLGGMTTAVSKDIGWDKP